MIPEGCSTASYCSILSSASFRSQVPGTGPNAAVPSIALKPLALLVVTAVLLKTQLVVTAGH